jgi:hypothetical protein
VSRIRAAGLGLAAVGLAAAVAGCGSDKTHGSEQTLKLTEPGGKAGTFAPIGRLGKNFLPAGSGFAFSTPLQDSSKKAVGQLNAVCIATQRSPGDTLKGTCTGTASVSGGQLALNVGGAVGNNVSGAIVGGTGKYTGATGTFDSKQTGGSNGPMEDTFKVVLP